jgi:hypothetical protein
MCFSLYILHVGWGLYAGMMFDFSGLPGGFAMLASFGFLLIVCRLLWVHVEMPLIVAGHKWTYAPARLGSADRTGAIGPDPDIFAKR